MEKISPAADFQRRLQFAKVTGASSSAKLEKDRAEDMETRICIAVLLHVKPLASLHGQQVKKRDTNSNFCAK
ncbi:MAG: hypothetical protein WC717_05595, partial [Candidatus Micrarchaeia archaeon]